MTPEQITAIKNAAEVASSAIKKLQIEINKAGMKLPSEEGSLIFVHGYNICNMLTYDEVVKTRLMSNPIKKLINKMTHCIVEDQDGRIMDVSLHILEYLLTNQYVEKCYVDEACTHYHVNPEKRIRTIEDVQQMIDIHNANKTHI